MGFSAVDGARSGTSARGNSARKAAAGGAAASLALREVLSGPPRHATLLAAFPHAVYLTARRPGTETLHGATVVAVVDTAAVRLPNAVIVTDPAVLHRLGHGSQERIIVGHRRVHAPGVTITVGRWWDPRPRLRSSSIATLAAAIEELASAGFGDRHVDGLGDAVDALEQCLGGLGDDGDGVPPPDAAVAAALALLGRGSGLTPSGDDVLAGALAGLNLLPATVGVGVPVWRETFGQRVADQGPVRTTLLSAALLAAAARGEVPSPVAELLRALGGRGPLRANAERLTRVGHTSGAALAAGVLLAARTVVRWHGRQGSSGRHDVDGEASA